MTVKSQAEVSLARPPTLPQPTGYDRRRVPTSPRGRIGEIHDRILALDIETVLDAERAPPDLPPGKFPKAAYHRVVAISYATATISRTADCTERHSFERCASGGLENWDEKRLLESFWRFFAAHRFRLVTWNGVRFDLPVLRLRSLLHGIAIPDWYLRGDRWANYTARFRSDWHADVMLLLNDYGAIAPMGLDEAQDYLGLPGKIGGSGGGVAEQVARGDLGAVRNYCEIDALGTLLVYWRHCHHSGIMTATEHDAAVDEAVKRLTCEALDRPHIGIFLQRWTRRYVTPA